jgi:type IV secretion system protein VirD4
MSKSALLSFKSKRSPTQNAAAAFLVMFICFAAFGVIPTQWFAAMYQYDPNLGEALVRTDRFALYMPTDWVSWGWRLADIETLKENVHVMLIMGLSSIVLAFLFAVFVAYRLNKYTGGMSGLHGTAHWAESKDIDSTGFVPRTVRYYYKLRKKTFSPVGVLVGSVMYDAKNKIVHPHHKKYNDRYIALLDKQGLPIVDDANRPLQTWNPKVVKRIELLKDGANTHLFAFCPTRSGKGAGMIIPTLLTYPHSVMVNDPKGEAYAVTSGFRASTGQVCIKFEPSCTNGTGACWNPLDEIRSFSVNDVSDTQIIMSMVCDPKGEGLEDHWAKTAFAFLVGVALHLRYKGGRYSSMAGIETFLADPGWDTDVQMYEEMMSYEHDPEGKMGWTDSLGKLTKTHPAVAKAAKTMTNKEDKERSGVLGTATAFFSLYSDETVARNTSRSDFLVRDLMTGDKPVSLYYVVGPADMERMVPLTRLFYALFIRRNAAEMEFEGGRSKKSYTFPLLMIIDEASSLKKLPILQEALGYVAGYGIRMFVLVQDIVQLEELYGDKQSFDSGAETRIVYAPNKIETAEKLARMTGKTTITEEKASHSKDVIGIKAGSVSINTDKVGRDLYTADEFLMLSNSDVVIFVKGQPPIYGRKAFYFDNPVLKGRAKMPAPSKSAVLRKPVVIEAEVDKVDEVAVKPAPVTAADKWAESRAAFKNSVDQVVQPEAAMAAVKAGSEVVSERRKKSRYADSVRMLTDEDRAQIQRLTQNVSVVQKVVAVEAF